MRVCTQVPVQPIAVNTAALGSTMLCWPQDSDLVDEDVDSAARGSTTLCPRDYALLAATRGKDLQWKPTINKLTKLKKGVKPNGKTNPTTNPKQAARAHKNNLLLDQITYYQLLIDLWCLFWSLNMNSRRLLQSGSKKQKQRKKLRRLLQGACRPNKQRNKLRRLWMKMALMRLGIASRSWSNAYTRQRTIRTKRLHSSVEKVRPSISISLCFMWICVGLECSCFLNSHVSWSCVCFVCSFVCIFSEAEALNRAQQAGRAASAKFREEHADRIEKARARLPDSKFGLIWSSARYVCVKSYVHLLVLMTLWFSVHLLIHIASSIIHVAGNERNNWLFHTQRLRACEALCVRISIEYTKSCFLMRPMWVSPILAIMFSCGILCESSESHLCSDTRQEQKACVSTRLCCGAAR